MNGALAISDENGRALAAPSLRGVATVRSVVPRDLKEVHDGRLDPALKRWAILNCPSGT
jgi:hypothetical protein